MTRQRRGIPRPRSRLSQWQIVNCLDKDKCCSRTRCAFTMLGGEWPFEDVWVQEQVVRRLSIK